MLFSAQPMYAETQWRDIPDDFWAKSAIESLNERGILSESNDQRFYPYRPITRAQFASILAKSLPQKGIIITSPHFADIPKHHWAAHDIQTVVSQGWMSGVTHQQFRPNQILTQGELYASLGQAQQLSLDATQAETILAPYRDQNLLPGWARIPVAQAIASGLTLSERSKTRLSPNIPATRASVAACVVKAMQADLYTQTTPQEAVAPAAPNKLASGSTHMALTKRAPLDVSIPAANVVGQLATGEEPDSWQLIRADGKRFRLDTQTLNLADRANWQAGQSVRVTGNLDAVRGTAEDPILVVQTCWPLETLNPTLTPTKINAPAVEARPQATQNPKAETASAEKTFPEKAPTEKTPPQRTPEVTVTAPESSTPTAEDTETPPALFEPSEAQSDTPETEQPNLAPPEATTSIPASERAIATTLPLEPQAANALPEATSETSPEINKTAPELKLYFPNLANLVSDPSLMLGEAVAREGLTGINPRQAVEAILGGPTESEKRSGYFMDHDLKRLRLDKFNLNETGLANVQLYAPGDFQFSNSSVPARLAEQIRRTLKQFEGIQRVSVSVKNPKDKVLWISP